MDINKQLNKKGNTNILYMVIIVLLLIISVLGFFVGKNYDKIFGDGTNVNKDENNISYDGKGINIKLISDKRCDKCVNPDKMEENLRTNAPFLAQATFEKKDFLDVGVKDYLKANEIKTLPAIILDSDKVYDYSFKQALKKTKVGNFDLNIQSEYDPFKEICDNGIDDTGNGLVDCDDPECSKDFKCSPKTDKVVSDLYIMSYCPYGLQVQKSYLEVMKKLGGVADINVKFVPYIMHGEQESVENINQYCIQKEQKDKYIPYLKCFLAEKGKEEECRKEVKIDEKKLNSCIDDTKKNFDVEGGQFNIYKKEAEEAGATGSPTFVVNGVKVNDVKRSAKAYADAICSKFKNKPKECDEKFQDIVYDFNFGFKEYGEGGGEVNPQCG